MHQEPGCTASGSAAIMALVAPSPSAVTEAGRYVPVCLGFPSCLPLLKQPTPPHSACTLPTFCPRRRAMAPCTDILLGRNHLCTSLH